MFDYLKKLGFFRRDRRTEPPRSTGFKETVRRLVELNARGRPCTDAQLSKTIEECEYLSWRLVKLMEKAKQVPNEDGHGMSSKDQLSDLIDAVERMVQEANARAQKTLEDLAKHLPSAVTASANEPAGDLGERVFRALQEEGTEDLLNATRSIRLFPTDYYEECKGNLDREVKALIVRKNGVDEFMHFYDEARESEIHASNIDKALNYFRATLDGTARNVEIRRREGFVGKRLARLALELKWCASTGRVLLDLSSYARRMLDFLDRNRAAALGILGISVMVPAATIKQVVASIAVQHDLSAADAISKFDPIDFFKFGLVVTTFIAGLFAILVSFRATRARVQRIIASRDSTESVVISSGLRRIGVSVVAACALTSGAWCAGAYCYWSDLFHNLHVFRNAGAIEGSPAWPHVGSEEALHSNRNGFVAVTTFGNLRVFRCEQSTCVIGDQMARSGETIVLRADAVLLEVGSGDRVGGQRLTNVVSSTLAVPVGSREQSTSPSEPIRAQVTVQGALALARLGEIPSALTLDKQSISTLTSAIHAIRWEMPAAATKLEVPQSIENALSILAAASNAQSESLKQLVSTQKQIDGRALLLAQIAETVERCAESRRARDAWVRTKDGVHGYQDKCVLPALPLN